MPSKGVGQGGAIVRLWVIHKFFQAVRLGLSAGPSVSGVGCIKQPLRERSLLTVENNAAFGPFAYCSSPRMIG